MNKKTEQIYFDALIGHLKEQADDIILNLQSSDSENAQQALDFFSQFEDYKNINANELLKQKKVNKNLVLNLIANLIGVKNFSLLKKQIKSPFSDFKIEGVRPLWFDKYNDAKGFLKKGQSVLLPFDKRYMIVQLSDVTTFNLSPDSDLWEKIGFDWVYPKDIQALWLLFKALSA